MNVFTKAVAAFLLATQVVSAFAGDMNQRLGAFHKTAQDNHLNIADYRFMLIPASGSFISNKMIVVSLRSGSDSSASQRIAALLQHPSPVKLAITSENDAVGAATLERALLSIKDRAPATHQLVFIGDREYEPALEKASKEKGVQLLFVPYP